MNEKAKRRSHWQSLAGRKYRRMRFLGGDGEWVVLSKCYDLLTYRLEWTWAGAQVEAKKSCGPECQGPAKHKIWKLLDDPKPAPLVEQRPVKAAAKPAPRLEPAPDDEQSLFWENRMGVDGL